MFTEKMFFPRKCHPENEHVPLKRDLFKGHFIFQPSIFRGYSFVFRGKQFVVFLFHTVKFANDVWWPSNTQQLCCSEACPLRDAWDSKKWWYLASRLYEGYDNWVILESLMLFDRRLWCHLLHLLFHDFCEPRFHISDVLNTVICFLLAIEIWNHKKERFGSPYFFNQTCESWFIFSTVVCEGI